MENTFSINEVITNSKSDMLLNSTYLIRLICDLDLSQCSYSGLSRQQSLVEMQMRPFFDDRGRRNGTELICYVNKIDNPANKIHRIADDLFCRVCLKDIAEYQWHEVIDLFQNLSFEGRNVVLTGIRIVNPKIIYVDFSKIFVVEFLDKNFVAKLLLMKEYDKIKFCFRLLFVDGCYEISCDVRFERDSKPVKNDCFEETFSDLNLKDPDRLTALYHGLIHTYLAKMDILHI